MVAHAINFSVDAGMCTGIVGANGSGKSTLIRTLANLQRLLSGEIYVNNKPLYAHTSLELATRLSLVLTGAIPIKNITVMEMLALGRHPYTNWMGRLTVNDWNVVNYVVETLQIQDIVSKKCYELSDGQLQKVMIARALVQDTDLIILDEPTTHLDLHHKAYILQLLKTIAHEKGKAVLFSSHEMDIAIQLCDNMLVMTENTAYFGAPGQLVKEEVFGTLFPKDLIYFDALSGGFKIRSRD